VTASVPKNLSHKKQARGMGKPRRGKKVRGKKNTAGSTAWGGGAPEIKGGKALEQKWYQKKKGFQFQEKVLSRQRNQGKKWGQKKGEVGVDLVPDMAHPFTRGAVRGHEEKRSEPRVGGNPKEARSVWVSIEQGKTSPH